jgi:hypothetical protein
MSRQTRRTEGLKGALRMGDANERVDMANSRLGIAGPAIEEVW